MLILRDIFARKLCDCGCHNILQTTELAAVCVCECAVENCVGAMPSGQNDKRRFYTHRHTHTQDIEKTKNNSKLSKQKTTRRMNILNSIRSENVEWCSYNANNNEWNVLCFSSDLVYALVSWPMLDQVKNIKDDNKFISLWDLFFVASESRSQSTRSAFIDLRMTFSKLSWNWGENILAFVSARFLHTKPHRWVRKS